MKKFLSVLLSLTMALTLLAGCGGSSSSSAPAPASTPASTTGSEPAGDATIEPAEIKFWYWADNTDYSNTMQEMIQDFNATNEYGITVVGEEYPWDSGAYSENLFTAVMGGGGPDVATFKLTSTPLFTANNLLADLDGFVNDWEDKSLISDNLWETMKDASASTSESGTYVMPWNIQVLYMYYRPSYFEAANIEVPTTYEEFLAAIRACTMDNDGDGKTDVYGYGFRGGKGGYDAWGTFINGAGGNFDDLTSEGSVQGMQDIIDLYTEGCFPSSATADAFQEIVANFQNGTTAMTLHHTGSSSGMVEALGEDVSAFPVPGGAWTSMGDTETVMMESCQNKAAAFEFMKYLATGKGQETWCTTTGNIPVSSEVQAMDYFQNDPFMKASTESAHFAGVMPVLDTTTEFQNTVLPNTVASAMLGETSAEDAMAQLQNALWG